MYWSLTCGNLNDDWNDETLRGGSTGCYCERGGALNMRLEKEVSVPSRRLGRGSRSWRKASRASILAHITTRPGLPQQVHYHVLQQKIRINIEPKVIMLALQSTSPRCSSTIPRTSTRQRTVMSPVPVHSLPLLVSVSGWPPRDESRTRCDVMRWWQQKGWRVYSWWRTLV